MTSENAYDIAIHGTVQGVGFRPFLYRLATSLDLRGSVQNTCNGVSLHVEGAEAALSTFLRRLRSEAPESADIAQFKVNAAVLCCPPTFEILASVHDRSSAPAIAPDLAACPACVRETLDPRNRRFRYPFTNCTACGPRFTICIEIPYDRPATTMHSFTMCSQCRAEYDSPADRRFHAQPNACAVCGPSLSLSIDKAGDKLRQGRILALKGIGGFQLLVDARNEAAVRRLRERKARDWKPLAILAPDIESIRAFCHVSDDERRMLLSPVAPIVLLRRRAEGEIAPAVAENSPFYGLMLPYSPLHHLLMRELGFPVVATSGNLSGEPIEIDNRLAIERLGPIADDFLFHDRPIARPCDDSVIRLEGRRPLMIRRARGFVPRPVRVANRLPRILAVGAHLKNTVAVAIGDEVVVSQHIGDLDGPEARRAFERAIQETMSLHRFEPEAVACDLHPDYPSAQWAHRSGLPVVEVQHHHAHVASCAAENRIVGPYLGVAWDGTGLGTDGTIWGGEFFFVSGGEYTRIAHLRPLLLPGGEMAVRQGWRVAMAMRWLAGVHCDGSLQAPAVFESMLRNRVHTPVTTSVGRLFDAVAAILGLAQESRFEGEAAMKLEFAATSIENAAVYPFGDGCEGDWMPLLDAIQDDLGSKVDPGAIAARFHGTLAHWVLRVARHAGVRHVVLSGGVFQNACLTGRTAALLEAHKLHAVTHSQVPPNDGGISLGQAVIAGARLQGRL